MAKWLSRLFQAKSLDKMLDMCYNGGIEDGESQNIKLSPYGGSSAG